MSSQGILGKGASRDQYGTFGNADSNATEEGERSKIGWFAAYSSPPSHGWNPLWYITSIRGAEWFHLYLWMAKDLAWAQDWFWFGMVTGSLAVAWSIFLLIMSIVRRNAIETWHYVAQLLWLSANWWWMWGELHDSEFPNAEKLYESNGLICGYIMLIAICWLGVYYLALKHLKVLPPASAETLEAYDESGIKPHPWLSRMFSTWREYENIHILFWLAKDCAWNHDWPVIWWIFAIPTIGIALDFTITTSFHRGMITNHLHYMAQFLWVFANLVWAYGELFVPEHNEPISLLSFGGESWITMRWYASWVLVMSFTVIIIVSIVWIVCSITGYTEEAQEKQTQAEEEPTSGLV